MLGSQKVSRRLERPWGFCCATDLPEQPVISREFCFDPLGNLQRQRGQQVHKAKRAKQLPSSAAEGGRGWGGGCGEGGVGWVLLVTGLPGRRCSPM